MVFKKSEINFLYLSVLVHGILFGLLLFLNILTQQAQINPIYEVTEVITAAFFLDEKPSSAAQKKNLSQGGRHLKRIEKVNSDEKSFVNTTPSEPTDSEESTAGKDQLPSLADENSVTEGVRVLNMNEVTSSLKRTETAQINHIEGKIRLKILVDENGNVRKITPLNSLGYGLDEVAMDAAKKLRFLPAKIKTKTVALEAIYAIIFTTKHN